MQLCNNTLPERRNENTLNYSLPEAKPCRDGCRDFGGRWAARALAMDKRAQEFGLNLTFVVGFDALPGTSCSAAAVRQSKPSIVALSGLAEALGPRAVGIVTPEEICQATGM